MPAVLAQTKEHGGLQPLGCWSKLHSSMDFDPHLNPSFSTAHTGHPLLRGDPDLTFFAARRCHVSCVMTQCNAASPAFRA